MKKKFALQIISTNPCTENWDKMTPNEQGKHCDSCNKTVIDFSLFTDKQLIEFFTKAKGSICGRIPTYQLQRQLVYSEPSKHPLLSKFVFGTTLLAGLATTASAQQTGTPVQQTEQTDNKPDPVLKELDDINPAILNEISPVIDVQQEQKPILASVPINSYSVFIIGALVSVSMPLIDCQFPNIGEAKSYIDYVQNRHIEEAVKATSSFGFNRFGH